MTSPTFAISIITHQRSHLLEMCLESVRRAMSLINYPVYVIVQDIDIETETVLRKYSEMISEVVYVKCNGENVERMINQNRVLAWETPLIRDSWKYVMCLEDDVEVASDIFLFTEQVIEQNSGIKGFHGINYGSFETIAGTDTYSRLRFGLHGPASLISHESLKRFKLDKLMLLKGAIAWDSWVEPIAKTGFMVTSNLARYRDNGIDGTHATIGSHFDYFNQLSKSFELISPRLEVGYKHKDINHSWRQDCKVYTKSGNALSQVKRIFLRLRQLRSLHFYELSRE
jgi:hypothetical protein